MRIGGRRSAFAGRPQCWKKGVDVRREKNVAREREETTKTNLFQKGRVRKCLGEGAWFPVATKDCLKRRMSPAGRKKLFERVRKKKNWGGKNLEIALSR